MYCRNCASKLSGNVCTNCGVKKGLGNNYCPSCGEAVDSSSIKCVFCGAKIRRMQAGSKSKIIAGLLGIFFGWLGAHDFYLGHNGKGVFKIVLSFWHFPWYFPSAMTIISFVWGAYEGINILTGKKTHDVRGIELH